ncbi:hypothetical protein [Bradyrhizobium paxllaeri]|uniref:hypothetical protein n=1 Tax=Bradyrhizobium paxllaeri TaxID=190148 RepID=UPI000810534D|nr:hypothetical protein [Bradyrhizobium paxllaeri]
MRLATIALALLATVQTAEAARHCLNRSEAARTWPTRQLVKDADGCWTYEKRRREAPNPATAGDGVKLEQALSSQSPAPNAVTPADFKQWSDSFAAAAAAMPAGKLQPAKFEDRPMMDRWPEVREVTLPAAEPFVEPKPLMTARNVAMVIALMLALVAVIEVTFGGMIHRSKA